MRMQNWATVLMSLLGPLVVGSTTFAQPAPGYAPPPAGAYVQGGNYPNPYLAQTPMNPGVFQPQFGPATPALPPGTPPDFRPYPQISPHLGPNVMQQQTYNRNGLWLNQIINRDRDWYGTVEYLRTSFEGGTGARIGSKTAPVDPLSNDFPVPYTWPDGPPIDSGGAAILPRGPGAFPWVFETIDPTVWPGVAQIPNGVTSTANYPIRTTNILSDWIDSNGVRVRGGYFDQDGTGSQLEIWWGFTGSNFMQYGSDNYGGIPITQDLLTSIPGSPWGVYPSENADDFGQYGGFLLSARVGAVPYIDNSGAGNDFFPDTGITGFTQKYDLLYRVDMKINSGGGNLNFFLGDVYSRPHVSIKSFTGLKYLFVDERFGFRGLDSGFSFVADPITGRPTDGAFLGPFYPLFESILNSTVTSHLGGPEFGFRGDLGQGGGGFKLWWQGSLGLLVNHERIRVQGNNIGAAYYFHTNIGDPDVDDDQSGLGLLSPALDMFANDTNFNDVDQHTHLSPTVSLGLNAEIGIFDTIPGLRKISLFDEAKLNLGYNMMFVGMMARAADSVVWQGFPSFPYAKANYDTFEMSQFSIGLHFER